MEYNTQSLTFFYSAAAAAAAFVVVVCCAVQFIWQHRRSGRRSPPLPPGPTGLPLVGSLLSLAPQLHVYFAELAEAYGPIYSIRLGSKLCVVVSSPALAREVLHDNDLSMANHDATATARILSYGGNDMMYSPVGPRWRMLRRVCVHGMLSSTSLDALYDLRRREVRATVGHIRASAGKEVEVGTQLFVTMMNVLMSMLWGGTAEGEEERSRVGRELRDLGSEMTLLLGLPNVSDFFPALERFDLQGLQRRMRMVVDGLDRLFIPIIDRKAVSLKQGGGGGGKDLLDYMLKMEAEGGDTKTPFTMTQVKGLLMVSLSQNYAPEH